MKDIKLSFPYPATSRHNLSQDVALSISMGLVVPVRVVEVLGGDSHRIGASFSLLSNPLVKPLLQGVRMRLARFWVPRRIYHLDQRANNAHYDLRTSEVRWGVMDNFYVPFTNNANAFQRSNFQASCLFDYLSIAPVESNFFCLPNISGNGDPLLVGSEGAKIRAFNAEPYLAYVDICRNYYADSASGCVAWSCPVSSSQPQNYRRGTVVCALSDLDSYIDKIQNSEGKVSPYDYMIQSSQVADGYFSPVGINIPSSVALGPSFGSSTPSVNFDLNFFGLSHAGFCVPVNRPDRYSRLFNTDPLTSQNATIAPNEMTIGNLSFLTKLQRYFTRVFFGGSRFTDVMYSVLGQRVPHVDSPVLLDVFDYEIGSELVASTNATETQNPGVLGGFFSSSGQLTTSRGKFKRRYTFNEPGYIIDVVTIMPRLYRSAYYPDFYPILTDTLDSSGSGHMMQSNFIPDFNGIGWQQPAFASAFVRANPAADPLTVITVSGFCCEPSWQQYRTLPDVCHGLMNPNRGTSVGVDDRFSQPTVSTSLNTPLFTFSDRMPGYNVNTFVAEGDSNSVYFGLLYTDFNNFNSVFGLSFLTFDNIFMTLSYSHQAKRQVTKRFTLSF